MFVRLARQALMLTIGQNDRETLKEACPSSRQRFTIPCRTSLQEAGGMEIPLQAPMIGLRLKSARGMIAMVTEPAAPVIQPGGPAKSQKGGTF